MGNRSGRRIENKSLGDSHMRQYGARYGSDAQPGLGGYRGSYPGGYPGATPTGQTVTFTTPGRLVPEPWENVQWEERYLPTQYGSGPRGRRPVIYVAAPLPAPNPCSGFGGGNMLGGFGGLGGGFGGGLGGGFGGGMPGANLGYQALPMMTVNYGGGIPGAGSPWGGLGGFGGGLGGGLPGLGGGLPGMGGGLPGMGGGFPGLGGGLGGGLPLF